MNQDYDDVAEGDKLRSRRQIVLHRQALTWLEVAGEICFDPSALSTVRFTVNGSNVTERSFALRSGLMLTTLACARLLRGCMLRFITITEDTKTPMRPCRGTSRLQL